MGILEVTVIAGSCRLYEAWCGGDSKECKNENRVSRKKIHCNDFTSSPTCPTLKYSTTQISLKRNKLANYLISFLELAKRKEEKTIYSVA